MSILSLCHINCSSLRPFLVGHITLTHGPVMTQHTILYGIDWDNTFQNSTDLGQNVIRNKEQRYVYKNKNTAMQVTL